MYELIQDYGIIGNLRSVALVSKKGSIDWQPAPYLDSPSVFAAILDEKKGGRWSICPNGAFESSQAYVPRTNILITRFVTNRGTFELLDYIPGKNGNGNGVAHADLEKSEVHRKVTCLKGEGTLSMEFCPRFNYARGVTTVSSLAYGASVSHEGKERGELVSSVPVSVKHHDAGWCEFSLKEGESEYFAFHYHATLPEERIPEHYEREIKETITFWQGWLDRCDFAVCPHEYPFHEMVERSALVLKLLFFEPPGSVAAAATTSLPEHVGGVRNWDYRFTWVRDSSFTVQALLWLGKVKEAEAYVRWLFLDCCNLEQNRPEDLKILYGLRGQTDVEEIILDHLEGYKGSMPVRIGNGAFLQKQWDVYGSVFDTVWQMHIRGAHVIDSELWETLRAFANFVASIWREPDEGLWEVRGGKRHFTHSKVMCWVALDRALRLARDHGLLGELDVWEQERNAIHREVMKRGWNKEKQSFVLNFDGQDIDALSLIFPVLGFIDGKDPKMLSTIAAIEKELSLGDGLLLRYKFHDGLPGQEGAFLLASFWMVDALVFAGERERAQTLFEKLLSKANHLGLYSEEMDSQTGAFLGNFPQAYTHIGLINSAFLLSGLSNSNGEKEGYVA